MPLLSDEYSEKEKEEIEKAIIRADKSGLKGICVECRGFADFEKEWWEKISFIFSVCEKLGLKVIIVDEDRGGPTGRLCSFNSG